MDIKLKLRQVITTMLTGNLREAIAFIDSVDSLHLQSSNKIQLNILITLLQVTSKPKIIDKVPNSDITQLITTCCIKISEPTESEINNYYRTLYHLMKFLCEKVSLGDITNLSKFIFPDWIALEGSTENIYELLIHFNILINNNIIIPNLSTEDVESLITCFKHHLQILRIIHNKKPKLLFLKIRVYVNMFQKSISFNHFPGFCTFIFGLLSDLKKIEDTEVAVEAYNAICPILLVCDSSINLDTNKKYVAEAFLRMNSLCSGVTELKLCLEIFQLFYEKFVRNVENYKNSELSEYKKLREHCEGVLVKYGLSVLVMKTFNNISEIVRSLVSYFDKIKKEPWLKHVTTEIQIECLKIFSVISNVLKNDKYKDNCTSSCAVKYNYTNAFTISSLSATFLNLSLRYGSENLEQLNDTAVSLIKDCCKYISQLKLSFCNRWISSWRVLGTLIYNISTKFYRNKNYKLAKFYLKLLCTQIIYLEGVKDANLIVENALCSSLHLIANCYNNVQQYRSALTYLAFVIYVCPEKHEKYWSTWMNVKAKANNNNIGNVFELSIKDILKEDVDIIRQYDPNFVVDNTEVDMLLFLELQSYYNMWPSKIPMNNTSKQILNASDNIYLRTLVFNLSWEKVISLQDEKYIEHIEKTFTLINKKDKGKSTSSQLCLSVLYFVDYQFKYHDVLKKNLSEMNDAVKEEKPVLKPFEEPQNPNDKCDIIPTYFNNKIENNVHRYKILNKSVECWTKILQNKNTEEIKECLIELQIDNLIKKTAFEYRLQNYRYQMVKIWFLYLQIGKILAKDEIIFTSIGFILESIDCKSEMAKNLAANAEAYLNKNISSEAIITYYINKSTGYLRSNLLTEGIELLNKAQKYIKKTVDCQKLLEARFLYLKSLYLQRSCKSNLLPHNENYIVLAQDAFAVIAEFYKKGGTKCFYALSLLFDVSLSIGKLYKSLRMPRETRCYTTESVLLAQQMVLPIRTVQYFSLLAFTDLLGFRFDDCRVKMSGIDYILGNQSNNPVEKNIVEPIDEKIIEVSKEFERINISRNDRIETMLDVPFDHRIRNLQGSPILPTKAFSLPSFFYHLDCNCFYCTNLDYQHLILESVHLEALFYLYQSNIYSSSEYFKGGVRIQRSILKKYDSKNLSSEMAAIFKTDMNQTYSEMLLDYSLYFAKQRDFNQALKIIEEIGVVLGENLDANSYFFTELLYTKINYLTAKDGSLIEIEKSVDETSVDYSVYLTKTPENNMSVAKFPSVSPCGEPISKRLVKKELKFNLDSDEENDIPVEVKKKVYKMKTPAKTPAPKSSKIKIFTPASSSRSNKIKPIAMSLSTKNETKSDIPKSPSDPESKLKTKKFLEKNTKILTEKLKTERRGVLKETNKIKPVPEPKKTVAKDQENVRTTRKKFLDKVEQPAVKNVKETAKSKGTTEKTQNVTRRRPYKRIVPNSSKDSDSS